MLPLIILYLLGVFLTILFSAFFSGFETSVISANRLKLKNLEMEGSYKAEEVLDLLKNSQKAIAATLVGNNITIVLSSLFTRELLKLVIPQTSGYFSISPDALEQLANLFLLTPVFLIFAEVIPKQFARQHANTILMYFSWLFRLFAVFFLPIIYVINKMIYLIFYPFGIKAKEHKMTITKEDIRILVGRGMATDDKKKTQTEKEMIHGIFNLEKTRVCEVMNPIATIVTVRLTEASIEGVMALARKTGYSRIPVFQDRVVNLVGYIDIYRIFAEGTEGKTITDFIEQAPYIPESKRIDDLLQEFIKNRQTVAIVVDEYGGCSGWVHIRDLVEEIVGDIQDEIVHEEKEFKQISEGVYEADGAIDIDDLNHEIAINLAKDYCETLGGFIYNYLGKIPKTGEKVYLNDFVLEVTGMEQRRIKKVKITSLAKK